MILAFNTNAERDRELALFKEYMARCSPRDLTNETERQIREIQIFEDVKRHGRAA